MKIFEDIIWELFVYDDYDYDNDGCFSKMVYWEHYNKTSISKNHWEWFSLWKNSESLGGGIEPAQNLSSDSLKEVK